ncbi:hypothetical protein ACTXT7_012454 [Hymenolepis weldensis]
MAQNSSYFACTELFAKEVIDCSSQYGEDGRTAFVAENLCGPPTIYPNFEDSTRSCAFLNYGTRWESFPGSLKPISGGPRTYSSTDYVDVFFERPLIVVKLKIYETFFPGAIVAIRACYRDQPAGNPVNTRGMYWATLWESPAHENLSNLPAIDSDKSIITADSVKVSKIGKARIFEPLLYNIPIVMTDIIRIEFDVRRCIYHTQIDAVQVKGYAPIDEQEAKVRAKMRGRGGVVSRRELKWYLTMLEERNIQQRFNQLSSPKYSTYLDEIDGDNCGRSSTETDLIQSSTLCPISLAIERFPASLTSSALMRQTTLSVQDNPFEYQLNSFSRLPYTILLDIFSYLDLPTLCRISSVCRAFHHLADDALSRMSSINLQSMWFAITDGSLAVLARRIRRPRSRHPSESKGRCNRLEREQAQYAQFCSFNGRGLEHHTTIVSGANTSERIRTTSVNASEEEVDGFTNSRLRRLDASWCGNYHSISPSRFCKFLADVGRDLHTLRLSSCQMVTDECLLQIINTCGHLKELDLSSCRTITSGGFIPLGRLIGLRWLNLYRTRVADAALHNLANLCQHLRHLNLGSCVAIEDADTVIEHITTNNPHLESLITWRCRNLTSLGVMSIAAHCPHLLRLDLGWCTGIESEPSNCLHELASRCRKLQVLSLAAIRSVTPADVDAITDFLQDTLRDLDLIGNALINHTCVNHLLAHCTKLKYLDISHCPSISIYEALSLRTGYNHCTIVFNHHTFIPTMVDEENGQGMDFELPQLPPPQHFPPLALPAPTEDLEG